MFTPTPSHSEWFTITKAVHYLNISNDDLTTQRVLSHLLNSILGAAHGSQEANINADNKSQKIGPKKSKSQIKQQLSDLYNYLPLILSIYLQKIKENSLRNLFHNFFISASKISLEFSVHLLFLLNSLVLYESKHVASFNIAATVLKVLKKEIEDTHMACNNKFIVSKEVKFINHLINVSKKLTDLYKNQDKLQVSNPTNSFSSCQIAEDEHFLLLSRQHNQSQPQNNLTDILWPISQKPTLPSRSRNKSAIDVKTELNKRLKIELLNINFNLPNRFWLLNYKSHHIVNIPIEESILLNSKERVPYLVYIEVIKCKDKFTNKIPNLKFYEDSFACRKRKEIFDSCFKERGGVYENFDKQRPVSYDCDSFLGGKSLTHGQVCSIISIFSPFYHYDMR